MLRISAFALREGSSFLNLNLLILIVSYAVFFCWPFFSVLRKHSPVSRATTGNGNTSVVKCKCFVPLDVVALDSL